MQVSVIIPNLNSKIVDKTVLSIQKHPTKHSFEIIVVGLDKHQILEHFQKSIKFINTNNPVYPGTARNIGVRHSQGEFLIFIDSDAIANSSFIDDHVNQQIAHGKNCVIGGAVSFLNKPYLTLCDNIATFHEYMPHIPHQEKRMVPTVNLSVPRELFQKIGGFNGEPAGEDVEFTFRARKLGAKVFFSPNILVDHHPQRKSIVDITDHSNKLGQHTKLFLNLLNNHPKLSFIGKSRIWLNLFSPAVALIILIKILVIEHLPMKYWHTIPIVYFLKCIWVIGASKGLMEHFKDK